MQKKSDADIERMLRGEDPKKKEMEDFQKIREYIRVNPGSNADDIALGTGIDERTIVRFIAQGKLLRR